VAIVDFVLLHDVLDQTLRYFSRCLVEQYRDSTSVLWFNLNVWFLFVESNPGVLELFCESNFLLFTFGSIEHHDDQVR
jgi:hypothetical protein